MLGEVGPANMWLSVDLSPRPSSLIRDCLMSKHDTPVLSQ